MPERSDIRGKDPVRYNNEKTQHIFYDFNGIGGSLILHNCIGGWKLFIGERHNA